MRISLHQVAPFGKLGASFVLSIASLLLGELAPPVYAAPFIERIEPPLARRGAVTRLALIGSEMDRSATLWMSLPEGVAQASQVGSASADRVEFDVQISPQAPLGLYGMRISAASGLSNVHLFAVDDLPLVPAAEAQQGPESMALPAAVWGVCPAVQSVRIPIRVNAGETVGVEAVGNRLGKDFDPLVTIRDAQGGLIAQRDNDEGLFFDCRFSHAFAVAGDYLVELRDARHHGHEHWTYILRIGHFPAARVALPSSLAPGRAAAISFPELGGASLALSLAADQPLASFYRDVKLPGCDSPTWLLLRADDLPAVEEQEPNDEPQTATLAKIPAGLHGCLGTPGERDWFRFNLEVGQKLDLRGESRSFGGAADLELALFDPTGREVQRIDDVLLDEAAFRFAAGAAGEHRLLVRDMAHSGGPAYVYRIEIRAGQPRIDILVEESGLAVPQGSYQVLPLTVTRTEYSGPIELALVGSPPGLRLEPSTIPAETTEFNCRLLAAPDAPQGWRSVQIAARGAQGEPPPQAIVRTQPLVDRQRVNVDLIKIAMREDQRRLPPTLTDRLAVHVTPPAPFTVELSNEQITLARFQQAALPIQTTRAEGFAAPITFSARGGQLGLQSELRVQIYAVIPPATPEAVNVSGLLHSRNLVNTAKQRVLLEAAAQHDGRTITLARAFDLDVKPAFNVTPEPTKLTLAPGSKASVKLLANRVATFDGPISVSPQSVAGVIWPAAMVIPEGQAHLEVEVQVAADFAPRNFKLRLPAVAQVGAFVEDTPGAELELDIKTP